MASAPPDAADLDPFYSGNPSGRAGSQAAGVGKLLDIAQGGAPGGPAHDAPAREQRFRDEHWLPGDNWPPGGPGASAGPVRAAASRRGRGGGTRGRRRQWGHDRRTHALPVVAPPVSDRRVAMGRLAIMVTVSAWIAYAVWWLLEDLLNRRYSGTVAYRSSARI